MNNARRKAIEKAINILSAQMEELESIRDEEQEAYDNLPEGIMYSERGEQMSENCDDLDSAVSNLEDIIDQRQDIIDR